MKTLRKIKAISIIIIILLKIDLVPDNFQFFGSIKEQIKQELSIQKGYESNLDKLFDY